MKPCARAARAFRSQQNGAVTRMWRSCQMQPLQKNVRAVRFVVKRRGCCCNLSVDVALNVRFTMKRMCAKNKTHIHVAQKSNNRVISSGDLYFCLIPKCEALRSCCSGIPVAAVSSLSLDQFYQSGSPNGKKTLAMLLPLMAKWTLPC